MGPAPGREAGSPVWSLGHWSLRKGWAWRERHALCSEGWGRGAVGGWRRRERRAVCESPQVVPGVGGSQTRASRHGVAEVSPGQDGAGCGYRCGRRAHEASQVLSRRPGWALRGRDGNGRRKTKPGVAEKRNLTRPAPRVTATSPSRSPSSGPGPRADIRAARSLLVTALRSASRTRAFHRPPWSLLRESTPESDEAFTRVLPALGLPSTWRRFGPRSASGRGVTRGEIAPLGLTSKHFYGGGAGRGRGRAGAELQVRGRKSRAPGAGPSAGAQDGLLGRGGRRHRGPGDPGPSPDAAQLLPSLNQRSGAWGQQPASRERSWDKPGVPETKPGASRSGRAGDGRVGGAAAALFGFLTSDSSSGNNIQILSRLKYLEGMEKHRPPGRNGSGGGGAVRKSCLRAAPRKPVEGVQAPTP